MNHEQWRTLGLLLRHYVGAIGLVLVAVLVCRALAPTPRPVQGWELAVVALFGGIAVVYLMLRKK